ncbi:hypothetical protein Tcan_08062, partial [Toxocara canis]
PLFSIVLPLTSHTSEVGEPGTALQQGRSLSLSHLVWQFNEVVQGGYKCPWCGGREPVGMNTTDAMKHVEARREAGYAKLVEAFSHCKQPVKRNTPLTTLEESWRMSVLNSQFALPSSRGGLCSVLDEPLQVIKEKIVREVEGSVGASVTVDSWSGKCIRDSFIAAKIYYVGDGSLKNAFSGLKTPNGRHNAQTIERGSIAVCAGDGSLKNAFSGLKTPNGRHNAQTIERGSIAVCAGAMFCKCPVSFPPSCF